MERFVGRVAVVSGSGAGIGAATAEALLKAGLHVVGLDLNEEKLQVQKHLCFNMRIFIFIL